MSVTLTSEGIKFPDNSEQTTAATGGVNFQQFSSSGTWNWSAAGEPSTVLVTLIGGGGGGVAYTDSSYGWALRSTGGTASLVSSQPVAVSGNVSITVGAGATGQYTYSYYGYYQKIGNTGGTTSFGSLSSLGGLGGYVWYQSENRYRGTPGSNTTSDLGSQATSSTWGFGGTHTGMSSTYTGPGGPGLVRVVW